MASGIYKIINNKTGKYYVGSSKNVHGSKGRWAGHKYLLKYNKHYNGYLQRAWNKYGQDAFTFILILEINDISKLKTIEQQYLDIAKNELTQTYNIWFDAFKSPQGIETRRKRALANIGRVVTQETRDKIRKGHLGKKHSKEHIANFIKAKIGTSWGHHSIETKEKQKLAQLGKKNARYDSTIYKWINNQTNETFEGTQYDFSNTFNLDRGGVNLVLKGYRNSLFGWKVLQCV